jgi:hypothetical protein
LRDLFVGHVDVVGKIGDDALDGGAYFRLPAPVHNTTHDVYLRQG